MADRPRHIVGALVFIVQEGRILFVRWRAKGRYWSLPGGIVEPGESVEESAVREVREETGLDVHIKRVVGMHSKTAEGAVAITLEGDIVGGELRRETGETEDAGFFPLDALPEPVLPHLHQRVADFRAGREQAFMRKE